MKDGVFYNAKIELIFEVYFREFAEQNKPLFSSVDLKKNLDELFTNNSIHQEFTRFIVMKVYLLVFSAGESERLKELFESKVN